MTTKTKSKRTAATTKAPNVRPLSDRVLIRRDEAEERTAGGIYLPDTAKEKPVMGEVVSVGAGQLLENGKRVPPSVEIGDRVVYGKYSGTDVKVDGVEYTILKESELLGIVQEG